MNQKNQVLTFIIFREGVIFKITLEIYTIEQNCVIAKFNFMLDSILNYHSPT